MISRGGRLLRSFFFSSRRRHTRYWRDWSSDVCSSDLIVDADSNEPQPWDDAATGELQVRGPWCAQDYYNPDAGVQLTTDDGWMRTGDVAAMDEFGDRKSTRLNSSHANISYAVFCLKKTTNTL